MTENTNYSIIIIQYMNIWFKTSRSGGSNITSTSRKRQESQMLPIITEQKRNFEEAEDESNSSDRER